MKRRNGTGEVLLEAPSRARKGALRSLDPWVLIWGQPYIDAATLATAIANELVHTPNPDFRTRLLVRDAGRALRSFLGPRKFAGWLAASPVGDRIGTILLEELGKPGFRHIRRRLVASVGLADIKQVLQLLGQRIHGRVEIHIAGSIPTLIHGLTARPTDDIDIVDEVPAEILEQRATLQKIKTQFGLNLGHVQSHYLPANWQKRRHYLGDFGGLRAYLVDPVDVFVSKLSSKQEKHKQDLRVLAKRLDQKAVRQRLLGDGKSFWDDPCMRPQIQENWQFVYQEPLVSLGSEQQGRKARLTKRAQGEEKSRRRSRKKQQE